MRAVILFIAIAMPVAAQLPTNYYSSQEADQVLVQKFLQSLKNLSDPSVPEYFRADGGGGVERTKVDRVTFKKFVKGCKPSNPSALGIGTITVDWACPVTPKDLKGPLSIFAVRGGKIETISFGWAYPPILCCSTPAAKTDHE